MWQQRPSLRPLIRVNITSCGDAASGALERASGEGRHFKAIPARSLIRALPKLEFPPPPSTPLPSPPLVLLALNFDLISSIALEGLEFGMVCGRRWRGGWDDRGTRPPPPLPLSTRVRGGDETARRRLLASSFSADVVIAPFVMLPSGSLGGGAERERERLHVRQVAMRTRKLRSTQPAPRISEALLVDKDEGKGELEGSADIFNLRSNCSPLEFPSSALHVHANNRSGSSISDIVARKGFRERARRTTTTTTATPARFVCRVQSR